jgi:hypothetical protein
MTRGAIEAVVPKRSENTAAARDELVRLRHAAAELAAIRGRLAEIGVALAEARSQCRP